MIRTGPRISTPIAAATCLAVLTAFVAPGRATAQVNFSEVTSAAGVGSTHLGTDLAWGDYDGDGDLDLYVTNWGTAVGVPYNNLYRNNGNGTFTDVGPSAGVASDRNSSSAAWGDYDNDGDLDLYVTNWLDQDLLYRNNGDSTFTNVSGSARVDITAGGNKMEAAWADFDLDGYLDLYLCKYYARNELYHNEQDGSFTQVADISGVDDVRDSDGVLWGDFNDDGYPDLMVTNRDQDNSFYLNNKDGTFAEVSDAAGLGAIALGKAAAALDYDLDGRLDIFTANFGANHLFRNVGFPAGFSDVSLAAGVKTAIPERLHFDAAAADLDGDGDTDIFLASGGEAEHGEINRLLVNDGGTFGDGTTARITAGDIKTDFSTAVGVGDFNNDFVPDFYVVNYGANRLFRGTSSGSFLKVRVSGKAGGQANRQALGARIYLYLADTQTLVGLAEITSCGSAPEAIFGLPAGNTYDLVVRFPTTGGPDNKGLVVDQNDVPALGGIDPASGSQIITVSEP